MVRTEQELEAGRKASKIFVRGLEIYDFLQNEEQADIFTL